MKKIDTFRNFFKGRQDDFAEQTETGAYHPLRRPAIDTDVENHLSGKNSYGIYFVDPKDNTCWHTVLDIDTQDQDTLRKLIQASLQVGIRENQLLLEFSGSKGFHIWFSFNKSTEAWKAQRLGHLIVALSGIKEAIEVFPKQDKVAEGRYGNLVKLPLGMHKKSNNFSHLLDNNLNSVTDWQLHLNGIEKINNKQLDVILEKFNNQMPSIPKEQPRQYIIIGKGHLPPCAKNIFDSDILEGNRDRILFKLAVMHRKNNYSKDETLNILLEFNRNRCKPSLSDSDVTKKVESAYASDYSTYGCEEEYMQKFCVLTCPLKKDTKIDTIDFGYPTEVNEFLQKAENIEKESIWGDGIIDYKSKIIVSGKGKIGKSIFILNLCLALSNGKDFLGIPVPKKNKILYLQAEISEINLAKRLQLMKNQIAAIQPQSFLIHTIKRFDILNEKHFLQLEVWLCGNNYDVVVFDPLYRFHNKEENTSGDMKKVFDRFDEVIDKYNSTVIIVHHHGKGRAEGGHQLRGSSTIFDWGDSYIMLNKKNKHVDVEWELRNAENPQSLAISWNENLWYELSAGGKRRLAEIDKVVAIVKSFKKYEVPQKDIIAKAIDDLHISAGTIRNLLKEVKGKKLDSRGEDKGRGVLWRAK